MRQLSASIAPNRLQSGALAIGRLYLDQKSRAVFMWCQLTDRHFVCLFDPQNKGRRGQLERANKLGDLIELGCAELKPIERNAGTIAPSQRSKRARKATNMAAHEIDRLGDQSATGEERASRKRRLLSGPKEFRDMRRK
jgi:hypothetical protein